MQSVAPEKVLYTDVFIWNFCDYSKSSNLLPLLDDLLNHPCLKQLERDLDIKHTCGYIRMLKSGAPLTKPRPPHAPRNLAQDKTNNAEISNFLDDLRELGIGSKTEEKIIKNEDQNKTETQSKSDSNTETMSATERKLASEWVPLELSFGIPLFSDKDNRLVCDKVSLLSLW